LHEMPQIRIITIKILLSIIVNDLKLSNFSFEILVLKNTQKRNPKT
jgi:hypothetical protein